MTAAFRMVPISVILRCCLIVWQQATLCGSFSLLDSNQVSTTTCVARRTSTLPLFFSAGISPSATEDSTEMLLDGNDNNYDDNDIIITVDETEARSVFGTKEYWDDVYMGRGDFPADQYSWYYGWEVLNKVVRRYVPDKKSRILVPGVGNDSTLVDLYLAGYRNWVGQDYSKHAVERQHDLLAYEGIPVDSSHNSNKGSCSSSRGGGGDQSAVVVAGDVTNLPRTWTNRFDVILEKGLLDAVYLSGTPNVERAAQELHRVLRPGGRLLSVSGVVPHDLRLQLFPSDHWKWIHDGSQDLKAGCFVLEKKRVVLQ